MPNTPRTWLLTAVVALAMTDLLASTGPPTVIKPAPATFEMGAPCPSGCSQPYFRRWTEIDGNFVLTGGPFKVDENPYYWTFDTGHYCIEVACGQPDAPPGPDANWQTCAYLIAYRIDLQVRRLGSGNEWASSATVAAGGLNPDEHKAGLRAVATPAVAGCQFVATLQEGQGLGFPETNGAASVVLTGPTGAGSISLGTYTSSNRSEQVTVLVRPPGENPGWTAAAGINQVWAIRDEFLWDHPDYFVPEEEHDVTFTLRFTDGEDTVPITEHTVRFYAWKVVYWLWNDVTCEYKEEVVLVSPTLDLSCYCEFNPPSTQDNGGPGVYRTKMTVHEDEDGYWFVDEVYFRAIDDDVFQGGG